MVLDCGVLDQSPQHRMTAEGMQFPWQWNGGTISPNLGVIWGNRDIMINTIKSLWRGEISLGIAFWVYYIFLGWLLIIFFQFVMFFFSVGQEGIVISDFLLLFQIFLFFVFVATWFAYMVLVTVGVWRSASNHPRSRGWAHFTKFVVIINTIWIIGQNVSLYLGS